MVRSADGPRRPMAGALFGLAVIAAAVPAELRAQVSSRFDVLGGPTIVGGPHQRTGFVGTFRYIRTAPGGFVLAPQISVIRTPSRFSGRASFGLAEVLLAQEIRRGRFRPMFGVGGGVVACCGGIVEPTLHAMEGFRLDLDRRWTVLFELRQRGLPQHTPSLETAIGVTTRL